MAIVQGQAGVQTVADGSNSNIRQSHDASVVTQDAHGRYQEAVYRGNVYIGATPASQALSTLATTATGLIVMNPPNSGKNAVLLQVEWAPTVAPAAAVSFVTIGISTYSALVTKPTQGNVINALTGNTIGTVCYVTTSATLSNTPIVSKILAAYQSSTGTQVATMPTVSYDIGGSIILSPGTQLNIAASGGVNTGVASITWEEIPV